MGDSISVTVNNAQPPITLKSIRPGLMKAGTTVDVTLTGTGFISGATLEMRNGSGSRPKATSVTVVSPTIITARVSAGRRGPQGTRIWDVVLTNPGGQTASLPGGLTICKLRSTTRKQRRSGIAWVRRLA
ncbi:MAG: hypothetical protein ACYS99_10805 [Planctomycetota bacterium]